MKNTVRILRHVALSMVKYGLPAAVLLMLMDMFAPEPFGLPEETQDIDFVLRFIIYSITFGILFALAAKPTRPRD